MSFFIYIYSEFLLKNKAKLVSMSIFEFDQELHNRTLYEEGHEDGFAKGEDAKLISQVCCKLRKGKEPGVIADELEEDLDTIKRICEVADSFAPEYNVEAIYKEMQKTVV